VFHQGWGHGSAFHKAVDLSIAIVRASDIAEVEIQVCAADSDGPYIRRWSHMIIIL